MRYQVATVLPGQYKYQVPYSTCGMVCQYVVWCVVCGVGLENQKPGKQNLNQNQNQKMLRQVWRRYTDSMAKRPVMTNMITSGESMTLGDTVAQTVELSRSNKPLVWSNYDRTRTAIACGWNTLLFTPLFFVWFRRLDRWFPGTSLTTVLKKVSLNQCVVAVPVNAGFLTFTTSVEQLLGNKKFNPSKVFERVETQLTEDLPGLFLRSCMLWFPVNMLNFLYVPATFRVVPTIFVSTVWSVHMSLTAHRHGESGGESEQEGQEIQVERQ